MPVELSCIIPCYHRPEMLRDAIASIADPRIEIIVVNSENDPAVAAVAEECSIHLPREGSGAAAAYNHAVQVVTADIVVLLNDDILMTPESLFSLRDAVAAGAGAAVPSVVDPSGARESTIRALPTPLTFLREYFMTPEAPVPFVERLLHIEKWRQPTEVAEIQAAGTPVVATRTELLRRIGYSEEYLLNWDEIEYFWRIREAGERAVYVPDARVVHVGGGPQQLSPFKESLLARNAIRFARRTQGRSAAHGMALAVLLYYLRLTAVAAVRRARGDDSGELAARRAGLAAIWPSWREFACR